VFCTHIAGEVEMNYPFLTKQGQGFIHATIDGWVDKEWVAYISGLPETDLVKYLDMASLKFTLGFNFSYSTGGGFGLTLRDFSDNQLSILMVIVRYRLEHGTSSVCE
jgi:hypothetical protein